MEQNSLLDSINSLFDQLFSSVDNSIYKLLDDIVFIKPEIINNSLFEKIIGTSSSNGILLICNSLVLGFIIYYAINYLFSHLIYAKIDSPKQFIFKGIIFIALMNSSFWFCTQIINIISIITSSISSLSLNLFGKSTSFSCFIDNINKSIYMNNSDFNVFSFDGIIKSFTSFGLINLVFTYSLRYIMIQIFTILCPFAILTLLTNKSDWFFKVWIKNFVSLLLLQILLSIILLLSFSIDINSGTNISKVLYVGIIYALIKANTYIKEIFGSISVTAESNFSLLNY